MKTVNLIAEIGSVHDGSYGNALCLIDSASKCGANTVKFQIHIASEESLPTAPNPQFFNQESRNDYFNRTAFTKSQWEKLREHAANNNVAFCASIFSEKALCILEDLNPDYIKVPSGELTNLPLLKELSNSEFKIILSTGMSDWDEIENAMNVLKRNDVSLLQCSSIYPCPAEKVGLNVMVDMQKRFNCEIGYSDHTTGNTAAIAAVVMGAEIIEKHFTFSRQMYGSDAKNSSEPEQFLELSNAIRELEKIISNDVDKNDLSDYREMKVVFEKSVVTKKFIMEGEVLTVHNVAVKKPGDGIPAKDFNNVLGKKALKDLDENKQLHIEDFE